ncbi:MAG: hypothetical protein Q7W02_24455 [Candidatus Rokubacteria bacterium]|nr:hypothetical protein [Candidatus Rokubacteria bacterium]
MSAAPAKLTLAYNGKLRDRVGQGNTALGADGALDGTLTATLSAPGGRRVTGLRLDSNAPGTWDTSSGSGYWVLAVAPTLDGAVLNAPGTMAVNFPVADGGSFVLFASDYQAAEFLPGRTLTLTATFADGSTATAVTIVGPSVATTAQLALSWVDNSGGQASFIIQRAVGTTGTYTQIAQTPIGAVSYTDATASVGTTYCYQVAAVNSAGTSSFSNLACGSPSGGSTLTAAKVGTAAETVGNSSAGINCGTACSYTYPAGTAATLAATPASGSTFSGWSSGACSSTDPCTLAGNGLLTVTATFAALPTYTFKVSKQGPGSVSSSPGGIRTATRLFRQATRAAQS